ncbi:MAG: GLPGLI family protein [Bacteroidia bacterium]|nr:MAG: GLPGLI family protein [Bacteroidia bacterium]
MRKLLFALGFLFSLVMIHAQQVSNGFLLSGEVVYEEIIKIDIQLEGVDEQMAAQIPKERKSEKVLRFTEDEAMFENLLKDDPEENMPTEGAGIMIKMYQPDNKTYIDLKNKKMIEQKEFMSRVFLIESELEPEKWKMTGNQRQILEYACQEAISEVEGKDVHAWFTPQIAVATGPGSYSSLPGLVLAVEMHDGDMKLEATSVELKPLDKSVLKKPTKGKKVTRDEYQAIVAKKMKEMGVEGEGTGAGSGHAVMIRIQQ